MGSASVGWITAIGGIAGWSAEQFMKSSMGLIMNIVLVLGGWIGYLISGFIDAVLLIWIVPMMRPA